MLAVKNMSGSPGPSSCHITYTFESTAAICGFSDITSLSLRGIKESKLSPLFVLREKNMSNMPGVLSCHTAYTFEPTAAICGNAENPEFVSLRFDISSKLNPSEYTSCKENDDESKINEKIVTSKFSLEIPFFPIFIVLLSFHFSKMPHNPHIKSQSNGYDLYHIQRYSLHGGLFRSSEYTG